MEYANRPNDYKLNLSVALTSLNLKNKLSCEIESMHLIIVVKHFQGLNMTIDSRKLSSRTDSPDEIEPGSAWSDSLELHFHTNITFFSLSQTIKGLAKSFQLIHSLNKRLANFQNPRESWSKFGANWAIQPEA